MHSDNYVNFFWIMNIPDSWGCRTSVQEVVDCDTALTESVMMYLWSGCPGHLA